MEYTEVELAAFLAHFQDGPRRMNSEQALVDAAMYAIHAGLVAPYRGNGVWTSEPRTWLYELTDEGRARLGGA